MVTAFNGCEFVLSCLCLVWPGAKVSLLWPHPRSCLRGFPLIELGSKLGLQRAQFRNWLTELGS